MSLLRTVTFSRAARAAGMPSPATGLRSIVDAARRNNGRTGLTGYLIANGGWYLHVLEGEAEPVRATLARVARDPRHHDLTIIAMGSVAARAFPGLPMDATLLSPETRAVTRSQGLPDSFHPLTLGAERVQALAVALRAFGEAARAPLRRAG